jgi:hypothetical protein
MSVAIASLNIHIENGSSHCNIADLCNSGLQGLSRKKCNLFLPAALPGRSVFGLVGLGGGGTLSFTTLSSSVCSELWERQDCCSHVSPVSACVTTRNGENYRTLRGEVLC